MRAINHLRRIHSPNTNNIKSSLTTGCDTIFTAFISYFLLQESSLVTFCYRSNFWGRTSWE